MAYDAYGNWVSGTTQAPLGSLPDSINDGGGGGGGDAVLQVYEGSFSNPNSNITPEDPNQGAIYTRNGSGRTELWRWDTGLQNWQQVTG